MHELWVRDRKGRGVKGDATAMSSLFVRLAGGRPSRHAQWS